MFYRILVCLHVFGVLGWFFAAGVEAVALARLGRATSASAQRDALGVLRVNRVLGPITALLVLVPGVYMAQTVWSAHPPWIGAGYLSFLIVFLLGAAISGRQWVRLERALAAQAAAEHARDVSLRALLTSFYVRMGILAGASFVMVVKPAALLTLLAVAAGILAGLAAASVAVRRTRAAGGAPAPELGASVSGSI
jgi:hypothetical protein